MVWYPIVEDIVEANKIALRLTMDKHPHRLRGSIDGLQHKIDEIKNSEAIDLTYQAARILKEITVMHAFDGANHRTAYLVTLFFLTQNGMRLKAEQAQAVDAFMTSIGSKEIGEVQAWIEEFIVQAEWSYDYDSHNNPNNHESHDNQLGGSMGQVTQVRSPNSELLEKVALEHLEALKLLAKNGHGKGKK